MKNYIIYTVLFVIGSICFAIIGFIDYKLGGAFVRQYESGKFQETIGIVTESEIGIDNSGEGGVSYYPKLRYEYRVVDQLFRGSRYCYSWKFYSYEEAKRIVDSNAQGNRIPVFYDENNPGRSVLVRGVDGSDILPLALLMPFNCIPVFVVYQCLRLKFRNRFVQRIRTEGDILRIRVRSRDPFMAFLVCLGVFSLISSGLLLFLYNGAGLDFRFMCTIYGSILIVSVLWGMYVCHSNDSPGNDLVMDRLNRLMQLPVQPDKSEGPKVAFAEISELEIRNVYEDADEEKPKFARLIVKYDIDELEKEAVIACERFTNVFIDETDLIRFKDWLNMQITS